MSYQCEITERVVQQTLAIRTRLAAQNLPQVLGQGYGAIWQYLGELGEPPAGPPFVAYYNMDMQDLDIELGVIVAKKLADKGNIKASEFPAGKFASCLYTGPYNEIESAYRALSQWTEQHGYESSGLAFELYLNDPAQVPPAELQTQLLFLLK